MIVNIKYLEKLWPDRPTMDIASLNIINPNPLKTLYALTIVQCVSFVSKIKKKKKLPYPMDV